MRLLKTRTRVLLLWSLVFAMGFTMAVTAQAATINEIRIDNTGGDTDEYFELAGSPGESLNGLTYLVIGDGAGASGTIENVTDLTGFSIQADGYFAGHKSGTVAVCSGYDAELTLNFENGDNVTHLLVSGFTGLNADDLDTNDDGVLDVTPWSSIVDWVSLVENTDPLSVGFEWYYAPTVVGPDGTFVPGHVYNCTGTWIIGAFDPVCVADTPGAENNCGAVNFPPDITNITRQPVLVEPATAVTISADIVDAETTVASATLFYQVNAGAFSSTAMTLGVGSTYSASIPGQALGAVVGYYVQATDDEAASITNPVGAPASTYSYTVSNKVISSIADIQNDVPSFTGLLVTIQAQVYCPGDYKADGSVSAYVQDGSGRGINLFSFDGTDVFGEADLNDISNIVEVSGTVATYFSTVELVEFEVTLLSTGNPALSPAVQASTLLAAAPSNEGTFIESTGPITAIVSDASAYNFTIDDGSGPLVVRVDLDLSPTLGTDFALTDVVTARGAGASFSGQGQILVCDIADFFISGADVFPPVLTGASLTAANSVTLQFNEPIDTVTGNNAANYSVFETATPANTTSVLSAAVQGDPTQVVLLLAASISGVQNSVEVNNVEDTAGNAIVPNSTALIIDPNAVPDLIITEVMQNPFVLSDVDGEWFEVFNNGALAIDMNGWTIRDDGTDSHLIDNGGQLAILPGQYAVFARNATALAGEGVTAFYQYATTSLSNTADEIELVDPSVTVQDRVAWDTVAGWPNPNGASMQWTGGDNNDPLNWATTGPVFGNGDRGTPGLVNDVATGGPEISGLRTELFPNKPNPFNPRTNFLFRLETREHASLLVYNVRGQVVRSVLDGVLDAGVHENFAWDGRDDSGRELSSGTYYYRLSTESGFVQTQKMTLLK